MWKATFQQVFLATGRNPLNALRFQFIVQVLIWNSALGKYAADRTTQSFFRALFTHCVTALLVMDLEIIDDEKCPFFRRP
jgi:hypothetical protein